MAVGNLPVAFTIALNAQNTAAVIAACDAVTLVPGGGLSPARAVDQLSPPLRLCLLQQLAVGLPECAAPEERALSYTWLETLVTAMGSERARGGPGAGKSASTSDMDAQVIAEVAKMLLEHAGSLGPDASASGAARVRALAAQLTDKRL